MDGISVALAGVLSIGALVLLMPERSEAQLVRKMVAMVVGCAAAIALALMLGCPRHVSHEPGGPRWAAFTQP